MTGIFALLIVFALPMVLFGFPLLGAFSRAIEFARDSNVRATPASPWLAFDRALRRGLRKWFIVWIIVALLASAFPWFWWKCVLSNSALDQDSAMESEYLHKGMDLLLLLLDTWISLFLACLRCAPRTSQFGILALRVYLTGFLYLVAFLSGLLLLIYLEFWSEPMTAFYCSTALFALLAILLVHRIRSSGATWFRFES